MVWGKLTLFFLFILAIPVSKAADSIPITLLHTNDLHSRFRSDQSELSRGGYARLKTAIDQQRQAHPTSILLDGGDWSEGSVYYYEDAGRESLKMLDTLGFDFTTLGNHDWLNGPDVLTSNLEAVQPKVAIVSSNLALQQFSKAEAFSKYVRPYKIKKYTVDGKELKVAVFGIATFEKIYDKFILPIKILDPYNAAKEMAARLRQKADLVILISHNNTAINQELLRDIPDIDVIIGAHDHKKFVEPIEKVRSGNRKGWLVEAERWGNYLGQMDLLVDPSSKTVSIHHYELHQIDFRTPENPDVAKKITELEHRLEAKYGPIFHDHVGDCEHHFGREGLESPMGNLTADAFREFTHADLAVDTIKFIYGELHPGPQRTVDIINSYPGVFRAELGRPWSANVVSVIGQDLNWLLGVLLSSRTRTKMDLLAVSGVQIQFDSLFVKRQTHLLADMMASPFDEQKFQFVGPILPLDQMKVGGQSIEPDKVYRVAIGGAVLESLTFLNSLLPSAIRILDTIDTKTEAWKMLLDHLKRNPHLRAQSLQLGNRIKTLGSDLGVLDHQVNLQVIRNDGDRARVKISAKVENFGSAVSKRNARLNLYTNSNGFDESKAPEYVSLGAPIELQPLKAGESQNVSWEVSIPEYHGFYPVTVQFDHLDHELNVTNNEVTKYFKARH
jgi:2',3'-cyclic-nucleotide 2'-phosphodiesterase (5'-nucleotidase family)